MEQRALELLAPYKKSTLVLGCSGGVDSMVLLHILRKHLFTVHVVHVNYNRRGAESDADQLLVSDYCKMHSIPCTVFSFETTSADEKPGNFQERARHFRYSRFEEVASGLKDAKIVLAHHADDQVETFLMNLVRKSGFMGLAAMLPDSERVVRPLLHATKHDLYVYAVQEELKWREDASNADLKYARNRVRNEWIPLLERELPGIKSSILILVDVFQRNQQLLESNARLLAKNILTTGKLEFGQLLALDKHFLFEVWRQLGQDAASFQQFSSIFSAQKGKFIALREPFNRVVREDGYFFFEQSAPLPALPDLIIESIHQLPQQYSKNRIYLNPQKINGSLQVRYWRVGDRIAPLGMKGTQLVSDIISDAKMAHHQRNRVLVVTDDTDIHWVVGMKIGRLALAKEGERTVWEVSVSVEGGV